MNKWKIGDVTITRIVEVQLPGLSFILPDVIPENLKKLPWLAPHFVDENWEALASVHALIIESRGQRIMVDTCIGNDKHNMLPAWSNRQGPFLQDLASAGFEPDTMDTVLCTHLHVDHVGWNTTMKDGKWVPTFPKADYLFGKKEMEHWTANADNTQQTVLNESVRPILDAGLETLVETDHKLTDEVWIEPTPGHTPGHVSVCIKSGDAEAYITADLLHHPSQIAHPNWSCTFDSDAKQAIETRKKFLEKFADTPTLIFGTHFATPSAGHVIRDGDAFRFEV